MKIIDKDGVERDWGWVGETYGPVGIGLISGDGYRVTQLAEIEGPMAFTCTLLSEAGAPVAGQQVAYKWPDGEDIEVTNSLGVAEHSAGSGEGYWPKQVAGPITWEVRGVAAETISGLGWLNGTNHRHLQVTMQWNGTDEPGPEPGTCDEKLDAIDDMVHALATELDEIKALVVDKLDAILVELRRMS